MACAKGRQKEKDFSVADGLIKETGKNGLFEKIFVCFEDMPGFNLGIVTP